MDEQTCWRAVASGDAQYDGVFYYGVRTTGVYCRPSCPSRTPRRENVRFFPSREAAEQAGFRPCKRCRPDLLSFAPAEELATQARDLMERDFAQPARLREELGALGVSRRHLTALFEAQYGLSPEEYTAQVRVRRASELLSQGQRVTDVALAVGLETPSAFTVFFKKHAGLTPSEYRARQSLLRPFRFVDTPAGRVRIEADEAGLTSLRFVEDGEDAPESAAQDAFLSEAAAQLEEYFAGRRQRFSLPLSLKGSPFQMRVWEALQAIPYGEKRSYREVAAAIGNPGAARAVGMANNRNPILIVIPCHRVVGKDGRLVGYAGGIERKQQLLSLEEAARKRPLF